MSGTSQGYLGPTLGHIFRGGALALGLGTGVAVAGGAEIGVPSGRLDLPETLLLPFAPQAAGGREVGWVLLFHNGLSGAESHSRETQTRMVRLDGAGGTVTWEVERTRNDACVSDRGGACPDRVRVIALPEGFMAVPQEGEVEEGAILRVLIVPAAVS